MPRFFCDLPLAVGRSIPLPEATARHAIGALRLREGDPVCLFNGDGAEYRGTLNAQGKRAAVLLHSREQPVRESNLHITLAQGISSSERMDLTLQKSVELGISAIQPLMMRRSVVKLRDERAWRRVHHWRGIVVSACEQCGRNHLPPVAEIVDFMPWLQTQALGACRTLVVDSEKGSVAVDFPLIPPGTLQPTIAKSDRLLENRISQGYLLDPEAQTSLSELPEPTGSILLLAGPEGGFDPAERQAALSAGWQAVRLGPRILRTETAALAALAAMQALWGDFR